MTTGRLWITDIYPEMWVNDDCKSTLFTSYESFRIDFQSISTYSISYPLVLNNLKAKR